MISFVLIIATFLVVVLVKYVIYRRQVDRIAGPPVPSIIGGHLCLFLKPSSMHIRQYLVKMYNLLLHFCDEFRQDGAFRLWLGPFHTAFVLTNADSVEKLLSSSINLNKGHEYKLLAPWLGDGLLLADSKIWRTRRKLLTPAFHFKILENFMPIFARHTDILLDKIKSSVTTAEVNGKRRHTAFIDDVRPLFEDLTLNIVNETSMGVDHDQINCSDGNESYRVAMKRAFRGAVHRINNPVYWIDGIFRLTRHGKTFFKHVNGMMSYVDKIINKRMDDFKEKLKNDSNNNNIKQNLSVSKKETIFLDILMEKYFADNTSISPENMRSEVNTFILGGHDTTAMALTFSILMVGLHPEVQSKIYEELDDVFSRNMAKQIEFDDLKRMRYLEMVIKETLRLYPSIQLIGRTLTESLTLPGGKVISAGNTCYVPIISIHLDPKVYPNPTQFNPDRFLPENLISTSPYAYIPFSAGPRNCIGQKYALLELKYVLASIFRRYRVTSQTDPKEIIKEMMPVIKPLTKIRVNFEEIC